MVKNAADRKDIRRAEKMARALEQQRREVIIDIMSTAKGRMYIWTHLTELNVFSATYNDNTNRMSFEEGRRNAGLMVLADVMDAAPDEFILAMREANARRSEFDAATADAASALRERPDGEEPGRVDQGPTGDPDASVGLEDTDPSGLDAEIARLEGVYAGQGNGQAPIRRS